MSRKSLDDWLRWAESRHSAAIELGLDRVASVARRLELTPPRGAVWTVAGTNGKGSVVSVLDHLLTAGGRQVACYTSPHLVRYNERVRIAGEEVADDPLIESFEAVEAARAGVALTYFEFATLSALWLFSRAACDAWVLEIGMGGRLDAVNIIDPDVSLITTVALDHQQWLGQDIETIAAEKAGILRANRPALYGDRPVPDAVRRIAGELGADLRCLGEEFDYRRDGDRWSWRGRQCRLDDLPAAGDDLRLRIASLALAGVEAQMPELLEAAVVATAILRPAPAGRFQRIAGAPEWVFDVAHNAQAAAVLAARLAGLQPRPTIGVIGMLSDKDCDAITRELLPAIDRWITCTVADPRGLGGAALARSLRESGAVQVQEGGSVERALALARDTAGPAERILVCGSFRVVGPALEWLAVPSESCGVAG